MGIYEETLEGIRKTIFEEYKSAKALAESANVTPVVLTRWLSGQRTPDFGKLSQVLDAIGARIVFNKNEEQPATEKISFYNEPDHNEIESLKQAYKAIQEELAEERALSRTLTRKNQELWEEIRILEQRKPISKFAANPYDNNVYDTDEGEASQSQVVQEDKTDYSSS